MFNARFPHFTFHLKKCNVVFYFSIGFKKYLFQFWKRGSSLLVTQFFLKTAISCFAFLLDLKNTFFHLCKRYFSLCIEVEVKSYWLIAFLLALQLERRKVFFYKFNEFNLFFIQCFNMIFCFWGLLFEQTDVYIDTKICFFLKLLEIANFN